MHPTGIRSCEITSSIERACGSDLLDIDHLMLNRVLLSQRRMEIEDAQAEMGRQGNVLGLTDVESLGLERIEPGSTGSGNRRQPFRLALGVDDRHATWSMATGSVAKNKALFSQVQSGRDAAGTALKHPFDPVHDVQDALFANDGMIRRPAE